MAEDTGGLTGSDEDVESPKRQPHPAPAVSDTNIDADSVSGMYIEVGRGEEIEAMKMKAMQAAKAAAAAQAAHAPRKPVAQSLGLDLLSHFTEQERDLLALPSGDGATFLSFGFVATCLSFGLAACWAATLLSFGFASCCAATLLSFGPASCGATFLSFGCCGGMLLSFGCWMACPAPSD